MNSLYEKPTVGPPPPNRTNTASTFKSGEATRHISSEALLQAATETIKGSTSKRPTHRPTRALVTSRSQHAGRRAQTLPQPSERPRRPPVPLAEQPHR